MDGKEVVAVFLVLCCAWCVHVHSQSVNCTAAGRFAVSNDTTCQNYTLCIYDSSSKTYLAQDYHCPATSIFNPNTQLCTASTNYTCNVTTPSDERVSICTTEGWIADPSYPNCTHYIECTEDGDSYIETTYACPDGTYFNPDTTNCEFDYHCRFACNAAGRFADAVNCEIYYFCVLTPDGSFIQQTYTCPPPSLFDPTTHICSSKYFCPK